MNDPTYDREEIDANPIWRVAFVISECLNDIAPIGWGKYIWVAESIANSWPPPAKRPTRKRK